MTTPSSSLGLSKGVGRGQFLRLWSGADAALAGSGRKRPRGKNRSEWKHAEAATSFTSTQETGRQHLHTFVW